MRQCLSLGAIAMALSSALAMATSAQAAEEIYKVKLSDQTGSFGQGSVFSSSDLDRGEWVVLTITDGKTVKVKHTTNTMNKFWGTRKWFDHPATAVRMCLSDGFETKDCQTAEGDTIALPAGKQIHDFQIDLKYTERDTVYKRSLQVAKGTKPTEVKEGGKKVEQAKSDTKTE
jgi:hypothetical protein